MTDKKQNKICYRHLSKPIKTLVVFGWILLGFYGIMFLIGFIEGLLL